MGKQSSRKQNANLYETNIARPIADSNERQNPERRRVVFRMWSDRLLSDGVGNSFQPGNDAAREFGQLWGGIPGANTLSVFRLLFLRRLGLRAGGDNAVWRSYLQV